jgi:hypothetical protein
MRGIDAQKGDECNPKIANVIGTIQEPIPAEPLLINTSSASPSHAHVGTTPSIPRVRGFFASARFFARSLASMLSVESALFADVR